MKITQLIAGFSIILTTLGLGGCSSTGLFLLNSGLKVGANHQVTKDIQFGQQDWQKLDVYVPASAGNGTNKNQKLPVLVFFYGGSWDSGSKNMYYFVANSFAQRGYLVVIPDYVKHPRGKFPMFMDDGAAAIDWVMSNIGNYGGDQQRVVVAGHSAGAHLGALLLSDAQYLAKYGLKPADVKGFAGLAGPYNFTPKSQKLKAIFGPADNFPKMQTRNFVDGDEPPMLLLHGANDDTVGVLNQEVLLEQLQEVGSPSQGKVYPHVGHVKILMTLTRPLKGSVTTLDDMDEFFRRVTDTSSG